MNAPNEASAVGVFDDLDSAENTINELRQAGFQADEIGIIGHVNQDPTVPTPPAMNAPEGNAITGFVKGSVLGTIVGTLVIVVIPGLGAIAGAGHWFEIIGGAALGAVAGGVLIAFSSFVFARGKTRFLAAELEKGRFVVTVKNPGRKEEAASVLRRRGIHAATS
jgi:hypothetical protein